MSIEFWKFIRTRFLWLNTRLLILFWAIMLGRFFDVHVWLGSFNVWFEFLYLQFHQFMSMYLLVISGMGIYAIWKTNRWRRQQHNDEWERLRRLQDEQLDRLFREVDERMRRNQR